MRQLAAASNRLDDVWSRAEHIQLLSASIFRRLDESNRIGHSLGISRFMQQVLVDEN